MLKPSKMQLRLQNKNRLPLGYATTLRTPDTSQIQAGTQISTRVPAGAPALSKGKGIYFMSRDDAQRYRYKSADVVISISDTGTAAPEFFSEVQPKEVLALSFHDYVTATEGRELGWRTATSEDADKVAEFVDRHEEATNIIVHCNYGQSRSRAVALAISHITGLEVRHANNFGHLKVLQNNDDNGNPRLYHLVMDALLAREEGWWV